VVGCLNPSIYRNETCEIFAHDVSPRLFFRLGTVFEYNQFEGTSRCSA